MTIPARNSTAYQASVYLHREGPQSELDLFAAVHFGKHPDVRRERLALAIEDGWLVRDGGLIDLSDVAREHFDGEPEAKKYVGKVAGPRQVDVLNCKAYVPPKRFIRADAPDISVRAIPSFYGKGKS